MKDEVPISSSTSGPSGGMNIEAQPQLGMGGMGGMGGLGGMDHTTIANMMSNIDPKLMIQMI